MEDDYKTRMVEEFHELKDRINKINDIIEKYNNGQRGHITVREASLLMAHSSGHQPRIRRRGTGGEATAT